MPTALLNPEAFVRRFDFHDGSHYQHDAARAAGIVPTVDFQKLRAESDVLEWKCTQSTRYVDPTWGWVQSAMDLYRFRLRLGYHWNSSTQNPITQAEHFLNKRGIWQEGDGGVADAEEAGLTVASVLRFCKEVEEESRRPMVVYSGLYVSGGTIWKSPQLRYECAYGPRPMHLAAYVSREALFNHMRITQTLHLPVHAWQYSGSGRVSGIYGDADMNKMLDRVQYERACGLIAHPLPPLPSPLPIPEEDLMYRTRFEGYLNVFNTNGGSYCHSSADLDAAASAVGPVIVHHKARPGYDLALHAALHQNDLSVEQLTPHPGEQ